MSNSELPSLGERVEVQPSAAQPLYVHLAISDPEVIVAASEYPEGRSRTDFIQTALKIGVLSLRAARGVVDGDAIRKEGDVLLSQLNERLNGWRTNMEQNLTNSLSHYFDPKQGMFAERVERLVSDDGDLAGVMKGQVANAQLSLTNLFQQFVGKIANFSKCWIRQATTNSCRRWIRRLMASSRLKTLPSCSSSRWTSLEAR